MKIYKNYKLTFWQKIIAIFLYPVWLLSDPNKRKESYHLVLKGAEKHKCNFIEPTTIKGFKFLKCNHKGCNMLDPVD